MDPATIMAIIAALQAGTSLVGGLANRDAAGQQVAANQGGLDLMRDFVNKNIQMNQPSIQGGERARGAAEAGLFTGLYDTPIPQYNKANYGQWNTDSLAQDPGYQFRLNQGLDSIEGRGAARGNRLSGATLKELTNYGQGLASQEADKAYGRFDRERGVQYQGEQDYLRNLSGEMTNRWGKLQNLVGQGQAARNSVSNTLNTQAGPMANQQSYVGAAKADQSTAIPQSIMDALQDVLKTVPTIMGTEGKGAMSTSYTPVMNNLYGGA